MALLRQSMSEYPIVKSESEEERMMPRVTCPTCGRAYKLKSSLRNHMKWECGKEPQFKCAHCSYRAYQKVHVTRHTLRVHNGVAEKM